MGGEQVPGGAPPVLRGEMLAGGVLLRGGPLAGFAVGSVAVAAAVLVPMQLWRPWVALPVITVGLALAWRLAMSVPLRPMPVWAAGLVVAVAGAEGVWAALTHAENSIVRRDPGAYGLYAQWIATRHGLPVGSALDAFGGTAALAVPGFTVASPAYYQVSQGTAVDVVPQFLVGSPAVFSLGWWGGGWTGMFLVPAAVGALAILAAAGLTARLVGPRWAPAAAASLAAAFPVLHSARSTYSETVALLLVLVAASLIADATAATGRPARALAMAGGLMLGLTGLVRVDTLTEVALLLPVCAVLALHRHDAAGPLAAGALLGAVVSGASALFMARPYLTTIKGSLVPLVAGTLVLAAGSAAAVAAGRWWRARRISGPGRPDHQDRPGEQAGPGVPDAGGRVIAVLGRLTAGGVLLLGLLLATRPLWMTDRQTADNPGTPFVTSLQRAQHLALDGARTYAEYTLHWVAWWLGPAVVVAAWITFAVTCRGAVLWSLGRPAAVESGTDAGAPPVWLVPAVVGFASSVLTLVRPGITPDHPWADRRLVPVLLPAFVIAATAVVAWTTRWARRRLPATLLVAVTVIGVVALVAPPLLATVPLRAQRTERAEPSAVRRVCSALQPGDVVVAVDARGYDEWPQVIRGVCGHPAASLIKDGLALPTGQLHASAQQLAALVQARGGRLVLLAAGDGAGPDRTLADLGLVPRPVSYLTTIEDQQLLAQRPRAGARLVIDVWTAVWPQTP